MKTKKRENRIAALMLAFAVAFTAIPVLSGDFDVYAAGFWKNFKAKATSQTQVKLSWTKLTAAQQKKVTKIVVYRNGKKIATLKKTAATFTDKNLKSGTKYKYHLKTYQKITKKTPLWYNKSTGKWQKTKPPRKYRGKKKTAKKVSYKYANKSAVITAKTKSQAKTDPSDTSESTKPSSDTPSSDGKTDTPTSSDGTGTPTTPTTPTTPPGTDPGTSDEVTYTGRTKTISNYNGDTTRTYRELSTGMWEYVNKYGNTYQTSYEGMMERVNNPYYNHLIDGEFDSNNGRMVQISGATFRKEELYGQEVKKAGYKADSMPDSERWWIKYGFFISMWGGDESKLTYDIDHPIVTVDSWFPRAGAINVFAREKVTYINANTNVNNCSDGTHLIPLVNAGVYTDVNRATQEQNNRGLVLNFKSVAEPNCGFASEDITFTIKYDGRKIGEIIWNPNPGAVNGMEPRKALAYSIAQQAITRKGRSNASDEVARCCQEMYSIRDFLEETYVREQVVTGEGGASFAMGCEGAALVFEAWSVMTYGYDGFWGCKNKDPSIDGHRSWNLNLDPELQFDAMK